MGILSERDFLRVPIVLMLHISFFSSFRGRKSQECRMEPKQVCRPTKSCSNSPLCTTCNRFVQSSGFGTCTSSTCGNFYPSYPFFDVGNVPVSTPNLTPGLEGSFPSIINVGGGSSFYPGSGSTTVGGSGVYPGGEVSIGGSGVYPGGDISIGGSGVYPGGEVSIGGSGVYPGGDVSVGGSGVYPGEVIGGSGSYVPTQEVPGGSNYPGEAGYPAVGGSGSSIGYPAVGGSGSSIGYPAVGGSGSSVIPQAQIGLAEDQVQDEAELAGESEDASSDAIQS